MPIYDTFTLRESDIVDNAVIISRQMIDELRSVNGWIVIVRYGRFKRLFNRKVNSGNDISPHGPVFYGVPTPSVTDEAFQGIPYNLVIKTPRYAFQQEYRIIGSQPVECRLLPDETNPGCKIEEYDHAELDLGNSIADFSRKVSVSSLEETQDGLMLEPPHHA